MKKTYYSTPDPKALFSDLATPGSKLLSSSSKLFSKKVRGKVVAVVNVRPHKAEGCLSISSDTSHERLKVCSTNCTFDWTRAQQVPNLRVCCGSGTEIEEA